MTRAVEILYEAIGQPVPAVLVEWQTKLDDWCEKYCDTHPNAQLTETILLPAVFVFDHLAERVCIAYAISTSPLMRREASRMKGFPDVNVSVKAALGSSAFAADRGHFLGHASGGELDINLFPHRRELNRGWSCDGKRFREMERFVAGHLGTFFYHGAVYDDESWIPAQLEYGVLRDNRAWWIERFNNKLTDMVSVREQSGR